MPPSPIVKRGDVVLVLFPNTQFPAVPGRLVLVLKDGRLVVAETLNPAVLRIYLDNGALDPSWPATALRGNAQAGPSVETAHEVDGQLRFSGVSHVNDLWTGFEQETGEARLFLRNAPRTALFWESRGIDPDQWRWSTSIQEEASAAIPRGFAVSFRRLGATKSPATVHYTTRDVTATAGEDYVAKNGMLTFAPFEVEKTLTIPILADTEKEWDETLEVVITGAVGFEVLPPPQRLIIRDPNGSDSLPPALDRVKRLRDGRVLLGGSAAVDWGGVIQFSSDLKSWHPLTNATGGELSDRSSSLWLDASATNTATRYYRAVAP